MEGRGWRTSTTFGKSWGWLGGTSRKWGRGWPNGILKCRIIFILRASINQSDTKEMKQTNVPMLPEGCYHLYHHANGFENLFVSFDNYNFFLKQYRKYIEPIADTYAYCLMPNHFHFSLRIKPWEELRKLSPFQQLAQTAVREDLVESNAIANSISKQFGNLFSSYAQAFNKQQGRPGSLFMPNFKRKLIDTEAYFSNSIRYIHRNPMKDGFAASLDAWPHSSFSVLLSSEPTWLKREEVLLFFGGRSAFLAAHQVQLDDDAQKMFDDW
jgi:REP element-mobilizing transposase RayT